MPSKPGDPEARSALGIEALGSGRREVLRALSAAGAGVGLLGLNACASRGAPPDLPVLPNLSGSVSRRRWQRSVGPAGFGFQPALRDGQLMVASRDGDLLAIDPAGGKVQSSTGLKRQLTAGVGTNGQLCVLADTEGQLIAVDTDNTVRWSVDMGAEAASVPAVTDKLAIVRQSNNAVVAYSLADGSRRWLYTRRNPSLVLRQTTGIAVDSQSAYVGLPGGRLVALALDTGATRWDTAVSIPRGSNEIERIADVVATPVLTDRSICAAAFQGRITCVDPRNGRNLWSKNLSAGAGVAIDAQRIYCVDTDSKIFAYSRSGELLWEQAGLQQRLLSAMLVAEGHLWLGDANGYVHTLDVASGDIVGRVSTDGSQIVSAPLLVRAGDELLVVVQTTDASVAAVSL